VPVLNILLCESCFLLPTQQDGVSKYLINTRSYISCFTQCIVMYTLNLYNTPVMLCCHDIQQGFIKCGVNLMKREVNRKWLWLCQIRAYCIRHDSEDLAFISLICCFVSYLDPRPSKCFVVLDLCLSWYTVTSIKVFWWNKVVSVFN
jgi:hypothetical protein